MQKNASLEDKPRKIFTRRHFCLPAENKENYKNCCLQTKMKDLILHETFYLNNKLSQVYTTFYFEWKTISDHKSSESFYKSEYGKLFNVKKKNSE